MARLHQRADQAGAKIHQVPDRIDGDEDLHSAYYDPCGHYKGLQLPGGFNGLAALRAQGLRVINPSVTDDLGPGIKAKKQTEATPDLRTAPVSEVTPRGKSQRVALTVLRSIWVGWHPIENQVSQRVE
jgi:hypothetical protein